MSHAHKPHPKGANKPRRERRAQPGSPGSVRWLKSLIGRPLRLEKRGSQLHLTLVDRRRSPEQIEQQEREQLCEEIRALLVSRGSEQEVAVMRHLVLVHDVLVQRGWDGVAAMSSQVLRKALMQSQLLETHGRSAPLTELVDRLRLLQAAAGVREDKQRKPAPPPEATTTVSMGLTPQGSAEVLELSREAFEADARAWEKTEVAAFDPLESAR